MTTAMTRKLVGVGALLAATFWLQALHADDAGMVDAGPDRGAPLEDDAGTTDAGPPAEDNSPSSRLAEPAVTLPPATPDPTIAPIMVGHEATRGGPSPPIPSADRPTVVVKTLLAIVALITLAYLGGHPRVLALEQALGISQVITAGLPFVLLGLVARLPAVGLLNDDLLAELSPLLRIGLGCIGFVAGFRFATNLRSAHEVVRLLTFATAVPFAVVAVLSGLVLLLMSGDVSAAAVRDPVFIRDAIILGTAGAMTATTSTHIFRAEDSDGLLARILRLEELAGIVGLAVIAAYFRPRVDVTWDLPGTAWLLLTIGLGATLSVLAFLVLRRPQASPEFVLLTLGWIGFSAGTAGYLRLSPVVVAFLAGTGLALLPDPQRDRLSEALRRLERPIYLLALIVIGALWQVSDWRGWVLMPVFTVARLLGKHFGIGLGVRYSGLILTREQRRVLAIAPIGSLAIAIVVNAQLLYPGGSISPIVAAVIGGAILTEVVVQLWSRRTGAPLPMRRQDGPSS
jgi:Kef-type K+ transport system membrane component KefB